MTMENCEDHEEAGWEWSPDTTQIAGELGISVDSVETILHASQKSVHSGRHKCCAAFKWASMWLHAKRFLWWLTPIKIFIPVWWLVVKPYIITSTLNRNRSRCNGCWWVQFLWKVLNTAFIQQGHGDSVLGRQLLVMTYNRINKWYFISVVYNFTAYWMVYP